MLHNSLPPNLHPVTAICAPLSPCRFPMFRLTLGVQQWLAKTTNYLRQPREIGALFQCSQPPQSRQIGSDTLRNRVQKLKIPQHCVLLDSHEATNFVWMGAMPKSICPSFASSLIQNGGEDNLHSHGGFDTLKTSAGRVKKGQQPKWTGMAQATLNCPHTMAQWQSWQVKEGAKHGYGKASLVFWHNWSENDSCKAGIGQGLLEGDVKVGEVDGGEQAARTWIGALTSWTHFLCWPKESVRNIWRNEPS